MKEYKNIIAILLPLIYCFNVLPAQDHQGSYFATGILWGKTLPVHSNYPKTDLAESLLFSFGKLHTPDKKAWADFYRRPFTGLNVFVTDFGNPDVFGYGVSVLPFITVHSRRLDKPAWHFSVGLGLAWYSKHFDPISNPRNKSVGSAFSWAYQLGIYRDILVRERLRLQLGGGWLHGSNGHVQLPNFGINVFNAGIKSQFYLQNMDWKSPAPSLKTENHRTLFLMTRLGIGVHEFGGPARHGGPKKNVYEGNIALGMMIKPFIRLRTSLGYRYYEHFNDYIIDQQLSEYLSQPKLNASNIYASIGAEFLLGHFAIDAEWGVNIYKPFFGTFYDTFEDRGQRDKILKSLFLQHVGLIYYVWDTTQAHPFNLGFGVHINANFGQADFTGASLFYVHQLKR
jgi:Lipid A 3-O-deacylase (PagL)